MSESQQHSLLSSYREMLLEHLFAGEVMRHIWLSGIKRLEIMKPQVDDGGYDLVLEANGFVRHVQLKGTFRDSSVRRFNINTGLASKPSGCVIVLKFNELTLDLGPFLWFGGPPGERLPDLSSFSSAKHTKANSQGVKAHRPRLKEVPISKFVKVGSIPDLSERLFGTLPKIAS